MEKKIKLNEKKIQEGVSNALTAWSYYHLLFAALMSTYSDERDQPFANNFGAFIDYITEDKIPEWIEEDQTEDPKPCQDESEAITYFTKLAAQELLTLLQEKLDE